MALPITITPTTPLGTDSPAQGDDWIRAIKDYFISGLGLPSASAITAAMGSMSTTGAYTFTTSPLTVPTLLQGSPSQLLRIESQYSQIVMGINGASTLAITPSNLVLNVGVRLYAGQSALMRSDGKLDIELLGAASETAGDILIRGAANWTRLPAGVTGQFLQTQGTGANPSWITGSAGPGAITAGDNPVLWTGQHTWNASYNFAFSHANAKLGLGTAAPTYTLDTRGSSLVGSNLFVNGNVILPSAGGLVGVGTSTPTYTLDIRGNILTPTNVFVGNYVEINRITAPASPATGLLRIFAASHTLGAISLASKDPAGNVRVLGGITSQSQPARALDTIYQNTTGKPVFVAIAVSESGGSAAAGFWNARTDASNPPTTVVVDGFTADETGPVETSFWVLPGNYYTIVTTGTGTEVLNRWTEWS